MLAAAQTSTSMLSNSKANNMVNAVMANSGLAAAPSIGGIIVTIIQAALSILALIFIILIIISGFRWMTAGGNDEAITKAQTTIKNALIGMIITMLAWAITYLVFNLLPFGPSQANIIAT